jgi:cyanophycin synthetase
VKQVDSRRLTGPHLLGDAPGALLIAEFEPGEQPDNAIEAWSGEARRLLDAVGWSTETVTARRFQTGAALAISAPLDALYAATAVNEAAWNLSQEPEGAEASARQAIVTALREQIAREESPALRALQRAAHAHDVACLVDEDSVTVGLGNGSRTWAVGQPPDSSSIDWSRIHDVPVALVTGTNGKSTTVRMIAAMLTAAGRMAGSTSTDRVMVGSHVLELGDYAGPEGARRVLRDPRVEVAVLETARGGLLRRGVAVRQVDAAAVTNIAADHLGVVGLADLEELAALKLTVARVVRPGGRVVLNFDDLRLREAGLAMGARVTWFSLAAPRVELDDQIRRTGSDAVWWNGDELFWTHVGAPQRICRVSDVGLTFGGAARYNVANALAAIGVAAALGVEPEAMAAGLARLGKDADDNPGRAVWFALDGRRILVDYAHNPHGVHAIGEWLAGTQAERRIVLLGQAGDRDDEALRDLARAAWTLHPDIVIVKELETMLRGRELGAVPAVFMDELRVLGATPAQLRQTPSELAAVEEAIAISRPGDLLVLLIHADRRAVLDRLAEAGAVSQSLHA